MSKKTTTYKLQRIERYEYIKADEWEKLTYILSTDVFFLPKNNFDTLYLMQSKNEYNYEKIPNVLFIDCAPHILEDVMSEEMLKNYIDNLGNDFFCCYLFEEI